MLVREDFGVVVQRFFQVVLRLGNGAGRGNLQGFFRPGDGPIGGNLEFLLGVSNLTAGRCLDAGDFPSRLFCNPGLFLGHNFFCFGPHRDDFLFQGLSQFRGFFLNLDGCLTGQIRSGGFHL